jgi:hypothetical protein
MTQELNSLRPHDIVGHIKAAPFLTPAMLAQQWGIRKDWAKELIQKHYHQGRAN